MGFMLVDELARRWKKKFKRGKGNYRFCHIVDQSWEFLLVKPMSFMNRSGIAIQALLKRYPVMISRILVICDDLNLPLGKIRFRGKGSDGGQRGLASVISSLGSEAFPRLRLGIGSSQPEEAAEFVLSHFLPEEKERVDKIIEQGCQAVLDFIEHGLSWTMNRYNS
jgi:PTH1 family peptidyl-tRNA hydrolase